MTRQEPVAVGGVWLQSHGDHLEVLVEIDGVWRVVISQYAPIGENTISHAVSPLGIRQSEPTSWEGQ